jgi:hypothetical protein
LDEEERDAEEGGIPMTAWEGTIVSGLVGKPNPIHPKNAKRQREKIRRKKKERISR